MKVLIVVNEARTVRDLELMLRNFLPTAAFLPPLFSAKDAMEYLKTQTPPDLAFMEVEMSDGNLLKSMKTCKAKLPVVYIADKADYVLDALHCQAVDYLVQPLTRNAIALMVNRLVLLEEIFSKNIFAQNQIEQDAEGDAKNAPKNVFLVSHLHRMVPVHVQDVAYFYIEREVTFLYTFDQKRYILNHTLEEVENMVGPQYFYRANRQYLVHKKTIKAVQHITARKLLLKTQPPVKESIIVSKAKAGRFLKWLGDTLPKPQTSNPA